MPVNAINPAAALADLLESWHVPAHQTPSSVRFNGDVHSAEFWAGHRTAVRYLMEIEESLTALEASDMEASFYRESVPTWYQAVFSQQYGWSTTGNEEIRRTVAVADLRLLRALAAHLDAIKWVPDLDPGHIDSLRDALKRAQELAVTDRGLSDDVRRYILGLIREAEACLDESQSADGVYVRRITMELGGAMSTVSEMKSEDDPTRAKWANGARNILRSLGDKLLQKAIETGVDQTAQAIGNLS